MNMWQSPFSVDSIYRNCFGDYTINVQAEMRR